MQVLETGGGDKKQDQGGKLVPRQRPESVKGLTDRVRTGHGNMFVTVNYDEDGNPFEVFTTHGKAGGCDAAHLDGISRLISMAFRSGVDPNQVVEQLEGITCCPVWDGGTLVRSAEDALARVLRKHLADGEAGRMSAQDWSAPGRTAQLGMFTKGDNGNGRPSGSKCPKCPGSLIHQEGCVTCLECGYMKCE